MMPRPSPVCAAAFVVPAALAILVVSAAPPGGPAHAASVQSGPRILGTATYRERVALSPSAVFEATLEEVSRADSRAEIVARTRKQRVGQVPIAFEIAYDPRLIDPNRRYIVRASLYEEERLRFASAQSYPVLTQGYGTRVTIMMRRASSDRGEDRREGPGLSNLPATFAGLLPCADCAGIRYQINLLPGGAYMQRTTYLRTGRDDSHYELGGWSLVEDGRRLVLDAGGQTSFWTVVDARTLRKVHAPAGAKLSYDVTRRADFEPIEVRQRMAGMFRYFADAARFRECRSDIEWPVAMSDDYPALERAYTKVRLSPGEAVLVEIEARIEPLPKMEGSGVQPTLVVEKFLRAREGECHRGTVTSGLGNQRWRPVRIGSREVIVHGNEREPWMELDPRSQRVTGFGGCNRFSGSYVTGPGTLSFGRLVTTQMACVSMETESAFLRALNETRRYRVGQRTLELMDETGRILVRLEERDLR